MVFRARRRPPGADRARSSAAASARTRDLYRCRAGMAGRRRPVGRAAVRVDLRGPPTDAPAVRALRSPAAATRRAWVGRRSSGDRGRRCAVSGADWSAFLRPIGRSLLGHPMLVAAGSDVVFVSDGVARGTSPSCGLVVLAAARASFGGPSGPAGRDRDPPADPAAGRRILLGLPSTDRPGAAADGEPRRSGPVAMAVAASSLASRSVSAVARGAGPLAVRPADYVAISRSPALIWARIRRLLSGARRGRSRLALGSAACRCVRASRLGPVDRVAVGPAGAYLREDPRHRRRRVHQRLPRPGAARGRPRGHRPRRLRKYGRLTKSYDDHPRYRFVEGDAKDVALMTELAADCDQVVAAAAMIGGISYFHEFAYDLLAENERILASTFDAAIAAHRAGHLERIIVVSSSMVYESATVFPTPEGAQLTSPPPISTYGFQKLASEYFAKGAWSSTGCRTRSSGRSTASGSASAGPSATRTSCRAT